MRHIISSALTEITMMIERDTTMKEEDMIQVDAVHVAVVAVEMIAQIHAASYGA